MSVAYTAIIIIQIWVPLKESFSKRGIPNAENENVD
jgi:hypothetical protein